jgi:hypothetical protein
MVCKIKSSKVVYLETATAVLDLENFLSVETTWKPDLWALFEDVLSISMRWPY